MPLIGELDQEGLAEVTYALLQAVELRRAHTAILDLTGFELRDFSVVARIESLARTTELLGAHCELSGVRRGPGVRTGVSGVSDRPC